MPWSRLGLDAESALGSEISTGMQVSGRAAEQVAMIMVERWWCAAMNPWDVAVMGVR